MAHPPKTKSSKPLRGPDKQGRTPKRPLQESDFVDSWRVYTIWRDHALGVAAKDTAERLGIHENTVNRIRAKIKDFNNSESELNRRVRIPMLALTDDWVEAVLIGIRRGDASIINSFGKGMGLYREITDQNIREQQMSDDELRTLIRRYADAGASAPGGGGAKTA